MVVQEGTLLWNPTTESKKGSEIVKYMNWLREKRNLNFATYEKLWEWSVNEIEEFWSSIWEYYEVRSSTSYEKVLKEEVMPGADWFTGAHVNYAEHIFKKIDLEKTVIYSESEVRPFSKMTWRELQEKTASVATHLKQLGVQQGDRVVAYMPNIPETIIAFLAASSLGAIWSSCSPEFGVESTLSRFQQIEPKVLLTVDGYRYNGQSFDRMETVQELMEGLPSVEQVILIPYLNDKPTVNKLKNSSLWDEVLMTKGELTFAQVPFNHPLWILYSSGTTGLPKAIVQGHGGILLAHLTLQGLQANVTEKDRFLWYTTTGWMMWNIVVGSLITGASVVLYDGSPSYPDLGVLWRLIEKSGVTSFGTSPGYILACMKEGIEPQKTYDLSKLSTFAYTGSPLSPEGFKWVYEKVKKDIRVAPSSGGTDLCAGIVGGNPILPVRAGEIPSRCLGVAVYSYNEQGKEVYDEIGEMVITRPFPSMPLYFWNDSENKRYHESYFNVFPNIWRHGDLLKITKEESAMIYGRSDSTINRMGVRSGSSEIYNSVEAIDEIIDSLVIDLSGYQRQAYMPLFIVLREKITLTDDLKEKIKAKIKKDISPRHIPDDIFAVKEIPRTLTGKKMEIPIRKILQGLSVEKVVNLGAMSNPDTIDYFVNLSQQLNYKQQLTKGER